MSELMDYSEYSGSSDIFEDGWNEEVWLLGLRKSYRYCDAPLHTVFEPSRPNDFLAERESPDVKSIRVTQCASCGWWQFEKVYYWDSFAHGVFFSLKSTFLKSFQVDSAAAPIDSLIRHIRLRPEYVHEIDPGRMERIVQSVFTEHFDCEVRHVGRTARRRRRSVTCTQRRHCPSAG